MDRALAVSRTPQNLDLALVGSDNAVWSAAGGAFDGANDEAEDVKEMFACRSCAASGSPAPRRRTLSDVHQKQARVDQFAVHLFLEPVKP
jgi:hypothetical protein